MECVICSPFYRAGWFFKLPCHAIPYLFTLPFYMEVAVQSKCWERRHRSKLSHKVGKFKHSFMHFLPGGLNWGNISAYEETVFPDHWTQAQKTAHSFKIICWLDPWFRPYLGAKDSITSEKQVLHHLNCIRRWRDHGPCVYRAVVTGLQC